MADEIREYLDSNGFSPFGKWFKELDARTAAKVATAIDKISRGLMSNIESMGAGFEERKIDYGPGYRVYFCSETDGRITKNVILLHGGTTKRQSKDVNLAREYWKDYKARKRKGET